MLPPADHDGQLRAAFDHFGDIRGNGLNDGWVNPVALVPHQRFTAEFQECARVAHSVT